MTFRSEYRFHLRDIPVKITVRLCSPIHSSEIIVRQSHTIAVPGLDRQEEEKCEEQVGDGEVLQKTVSELVCVYNAAIAKGLKPETSWLQPDPTFC
ncbi:MAG: hypothetical protein ACR2G0_02545 [Chthoniobacterales bacterium]